MVSFEYKVVPAPVKGAKKVKGLRSTPDRFAHTLETLMNEHGADGWEYQRTDTLPCEEREGLMGKTTSFQHMLVFRRTIAEPASESAEDKFNERVTEALTAPKDPPLLEKPAEAKPSAPALKQPPVMSAPKTSEAAAPKKPDTSSVPAPAPRPNMAAE